MDYRASKSKVPNIAAFLLVTVYHIVTGDKTRISSYDPPTKKKYGIDFKK